MSDLERREEEKRVRDALERLEEPYRSAVAMRHVDGLSARDVAARQEVTPEAARQRISRGLAMLRARLDREYGGREAWSVACVDLVRRATGSVAASGTISGVMLMGVNLKLVAALLVATLASLVAWNFRPDGAGEALGPRSDPAHDVALDAVGDAPERTAEKEALREPLVAPAALDARPAALVPDRERDLFGVVLDPDGRPVPGASVTAWRDESRGYSIPDAALARRLDPRHTSTDERGEFLLELPPGEPHEMEVRDHGALFAPARYGDRYAGERVVVTLSAGAEVHGRVLRAADGSPVPDAELRFLSRWNEILGAEFARATSDAQGRFLVGGLPPGKLWIEALPPRAAQAHVEVELRAGERLERDLRVEDGDVVHGVVLDAWTDLPIAGASVSASWNFTRPSSTDARGEFELPGLCTDCAQVHVRAPGYEVQWRYARSLQGPLLPPLEFRLAPALAVRGRVFDERGAPLEDVYAAVGAGFGNRMLKNADIGWTSARSGADGAFAIDGVRRAGTYVLYLRKAGYATTTYDLPAPLPEQEAIEAGPVVLAPGLLLRGEVVDDAGRPRADWPVDLWGWNADRSRMSATGTDELDPYVAARHARTDDLGRFGFGELAPGEYVLAAKHPQQAAGTERSVTLVAGREPESVSLVVPGGLSIAGRVLDPQGRALGGFEITLRPDLVVPDEHAERNQYGRVDSDGRFRFDGLVPGSYRVALTPNRVRPEDAEQRLFVFTDVTGVAAGSDDVVLRPKLAGFIRGRVLGADGDPRKSVIVWAADASGKRLQDALTDGAGRFELRVASDETFDLTAEPPIPSERYIVGIEGNPDPATHARLAGVAAGGPEVELRLPPDR